MVKITDVSADYDDALPVFGTVLIIHLDNTHSYPNDKLNALFRVSAHRHKIFGQNSATFPRIFHWRKLQYINV